MKCPFCSYFESKVIDSRPINEGKSIRRRRECLDCQKRFTTYESVETLPVFVIKKDKTRQTFERQKLINGLINACANRSISIGVIESIADSIEATIQNLLVKEITSDKLAEMVMEKLRDIDEVAYVRFASVTNRFSDVDSFFELLNELKNKKIK